VTQRAEATFTSKTIALLRKDIHVELRGRDTLPPMLAFAFAVALLLTFTLPAEGRLRAPTETPFGTVAFADVLSGFFWISVLFAGLIGFARTFESERDDGALDAMLLVPLDRSGLFAAKAMTNLVFIAVVELFLLPAFALMFGLNLGARWFVLVLVVVLADIGFVCSGTLFAALAAHTRSRELMLPILALPVLVPVFIAATELTGDLFLGGGLDDVAARGWFGVLSAFDVVSATIGALAFEYALQ
jgi:heme exporter protein B